MSEPSHEAGGCCPVWWTGRRAVVVLPEHVDVANVGAIREQLLTILNRGASVVIADLSRTASLDHAGADALTRVYQRALATGIPLRLVVTAQIVRRVIAISGLDRLVPVYPALDAALAAPAMAEVLPLVPRQARATEDGWSRRADAPDTEEPAGGQGTCVRLGVLQQVADALADGIALADEAGILILVNRRLGEMFGYEPASLPGRPLDTFIPAGLQEADRRSAAARHPSARQDADPAAAAPLTGRRQDGTMIGLRVKFIAVPARSGQLLTLAVIRDSAGGLRRAASLAGATSG
jgi:anti-anti-sigma factor